MSNYADGDYDTKYGKIHMSNPGPVTAYGNLQVYIQKNPQYVKLQGPALRAFRAAETRIATRRKPYILITGHGFRSYADQMALWKTDKQRYAHPDGSMHVEGLAVDIDQNQSLLRKRAIKRALEAEGWHYAVAGEPWHASFKLGG